MKKLEVMAGKWSGKAEMTGPQGKTLLDQTEDIRWELGGKLLVIKGEGKNAQSGETAFQAYGVIHWDDPAQKYIFNAYTSDGRYTQADARWEGEKFIWQFDVPSGGTVRYTVEFGEGTWVEDGHFSRDGQNWFPFIHLDLKKN